MLYALADFSTTHYDHRLKDSCVSVCCTPLGLSIKPVSRGIDNIRLGGSIRADTLVSLKPVAQSKVAIQGRAAQGAAT